MKYYFGKIDKHKRNARLSELGPLTIQTYKYHLPSPVLSSTYSYYYEKFKEGAIFVPRNLWFISFEPHRTLGINLNRPLVKTSQEVMEVGKEAWKDIVLKGNVEADYIYATILGRDLIPFGYIKFRPVILPITPLSMDFRLLNVEELRRIGAAKTADWVETCQNFWEKRRTQKSVENYPSVTDRLDHNKLLTSQDPDKRYVVVYNARGANAVAHVVDKYKLPKFKFDSSGIKPKQFVADYTAFCYETKVISEAHYLSSVLNSSIVNKKVKDFQPRGNYGYRDIGRRPLMLHIPKFNSKLPDHLALVSLSTKCHDMILEHNFVKKGFKGKRNEALKLLSENLREIDTIVRRLLVL